ncbi:MAG: WD40/YVTN/BNR-like repeat-containing protein, partial [Planctomycetota bacterium]
MRCVKAAASAAVAVCLVSLFTGACTTPPRPTGADVGHERAGPTLTAEQVEAGWAALHRKRAKLERQGPKAFDKPDLAAKFFLEQRLAEGEDMLPIAHLRAELDGVLARESRLAQSAAGAADGAALPGGIQSWSWLGPGNIGGRTRAIVIDPDDPDVMYAGGVAGGVWKSTDGGASWNTTDDLMLNLAVTSLAMDPTDPSVLYAGTGEGVYVNQVFLQGLGIFKSTDAGATWNQLAGTVTGVPSGAFHYVNKLVVSPNDSNRVYAATRTGVWRSLDAGANWSLVLGNPAYLIGPWNSHGCLVGCTDLVIRQDTNPDMLFAVFGNQQADGLFRTFDGGNTWETYSVPPNQGRTTIALAPSDNDVMYLLMADNGSGGAFGSILNVYRSEDGGDTFTGQVDFGSLTGPWLLSNLILATGCLEGDTYSQGWYDNIIAVDPADPDVVWVGGVDMFRSDDGGVTFDIPAYWIFYTTFPPPPFQMHPDHHAIVFHPDYDGVTNQTMYVGNDGGLFRTQNARAATSQEDCPLPGDLPLPEIV